MKLLALIPLMTAVLALLAPPAAAETDPRGEWPLAPQPEIVRGFDPPEAVWSSGHRGVDLSGTVGQPVQAALPGTVSFAGSIAGVGVVVVDHGATRTTYQPVRPAVRVGKEVAAGSVVGTLEWYGTHCLPATCLHWGLVRGDTYLDPLTLVGGPRPIRLLPLGAVHPLSGPTGPQGPVAPRPPHPFLLQSTPW